MSAKLPDHVRFDIRASFIRLCHVPGVDRIAAKRVLQLLSIPMAKRVSDYRFSCWMASHFRKRQATGAEIPLDESAEFSAEGELRCALDILNREFSQDTIPPESDVAQILRLVDLSVSNTNIECYWTIIASVLGIKHIYRIVLVHLLIRYSSFRSSLLSTSWCSHPVFSHRSSAMTLPASSSSSSKETALRHHSDEREACLMRKWCS